MVGLEDCSTSSRAWRERAASEQQ